MSDWSSDVCSSDLLFLDATCSGRDQLPGRVVQQQHGGGVSPEHFPHALDQSAQQRILVEPGQRGIRQGFDVAQPVSGQPPGTGVPGKGDSHGYKLRPRTVPNNYSAPVVT